MNKIPVFLLILFFIACSSEEVDNNVDGKDISLDRLEWMVGKWKGNVNNENFMEFWERDASGSYTGKGFIVNGNDTILAEKMAIKKINGNVFYVADVPENNEPVHYKLVRLNPNDALYKNDEHDFPKRINYIFNEEDLLYAKIEGEVNGERQEKEFFFERIK